jgi:uncharacterized protein (DUF1015 family)
VKPIPFRATRYCSEKINLSNTICPPYDVIDEALADKLVKQSKYNSINLSFNVREKHGKDKYAHISKLIQQWKNKKILMKDSKPAFYYLEEKFKWKGKTKTRSGIFALIPVRRNKYVVPHEKVFPEAVRDRLELLKSTKTHVSPIFLVFEDEKKKLHHFLKQERKSIDLTQVKYKNDNIDYKFGIIDDKSRIEEIQHILKDQYLLIADGHHRYATAQKYAEEKGKEQYILALIAPSRDLIFSYHKVLSTILESDKVTTGQILKTCKKGQLLPQKSTYFYPKVMTGFVLSELS